MATEVAASAKTSPDPEVVAVASRRVFSASYKRRIVREADACNASGAIGALLRKEGLYSSILHKWRQEIEAAENAASPNKPRGPKPDPAKAADRRVQELLRENEKLRKKLARSEKIVEVQKKLCDLLGLPAAEEAP